MDNTVLFPLGNNQFAIIDTEDLAMIATRKWHMSGGYAVHRVWMGRGQHSPIIFMHRLIMPAPQGMVVDHIDRNRLNNSKANLRICTLQENCQNRTVNSNSATGARGVFRSNGGYRVRVKYHGCQHEVGSFSTLQEATKAFMVARDEVERNGFYVRPNGSSSLAPGVARGEQNNHARLTAQDVLDIRARVRSGDKVAQIAKEYNLERSYVYGLKNGKYWKHLPF